MLDDLGIELRQDANGDWLVFDGDESRCATLNERVLWNALILATNRYRQLCSRIRPLYRPGYSKTELYIDGQTIGWHRGEGSYQAAIDAAIDAEIPSHSQGGE